VGAWEEWGAGVTEYFQGGGGRSREEKCEVGLIGEALCQFILHKGKKLDLRFKQTRDAERTGRDYPARRGSV